MAEAETRVCLDCGQHLPLTSFRKNKTMRGGHTNRCKPCLLLRDRARVDAMDPGARAEMLERYREGRADYRRRNPDAVKARKADHYRRTKDHHKELGYAWRRKNPERLRELARGWGARRRALTRDGMTAAQTANWYAKQKKVCHWCGTKAAPNWHIDHRTPLAKGGKHEARNLVIACPPCNLRKNDKDPIEWAQMIGKLL